MTDQQLEFLKHHVVKSGIIYDSRAIKTQSEVLHGEKTFLSTNAYDFRFKSYEHRWHCNVFTYCESWYNVWAFVINTTTGQKVKLRAVETAIEIRAAPPIDFDPSKGQYYQHFDNVEDFYIGCGHKDGHDPDYWGVARCYFGTGEIISWRWTSHA
jgi:hypothetical protein